MSMTEFFEETSKLSRQLNDIDIKYKTMTCSDRYMLGPYVSRAEYEHMKSKLEHKLERARWQRDCKEAALRELGRMLAALLHKQEPK